MVIGTNISYHELYKTYISSQVDLVIVRYDSEINKYEYRPYSHFVQDNALEKLSDLLINNMVFYAFSEQEILDLHNRNMILDDLKHAAKYAYKTRLPKRTDPNTDGTPGELLLDLLIQVYEPDSRKLIARPKFKQFGDNNEIKGYDSAYFTQTNEEIKLWLGQVKTGGFDYCKTGICQDLKLKYIAEYFSRFLFFLSDKVEKDNDLKEILDEINDISFETVDMESKVRCDRLLTYIREKGIKIIIPCILAYTSDIYSSPDELKEKVMECTKEMVKYFDDREFAIADDIDYRLLFYVFPMRNVQLLRELIMQFKTGS